jgi:hypothetical protein
LWLPNYALLYFLLTVNFVFTENVEVMTLIFFTFVFKFYSSISTIGTLEKHSLLVLSYWKVFPFLLFFPIEDRDHTDSRRIKPNSRTLLIGEQPNPSKIFPPEDRVSRHRGVKQPWQCVLSPAINLFKFVYIKIFNSLFPLFTKWFRLCHHLFNFKYKWRKGG